MFDFLRNLTRTEEEKRQDRLSAYLDNALTPQQSQAFEKELEEDSALQANLEQLRLVKQNLSQMPRVRAPRNFTLDPAAYGRPASQPAFTLYPILRGATALAAIMLVFLFILEWVYPPLDQGTVAQVPARSTNIGLDEAADASEETAVEEPLAESEPAVPAEEAGEAAATVETLVEEEAMEEVVEEAEEAAEEPALAPAAEPAEDTGPTFNNENAVEGPVEGTADADSQGFGADGGITSQLPTPTLDTNLYSTTETAPIPTISTAEEIGLDDPPVTPLRLLQSGLGILFLLLLAATWLTRRRL